MSADAAELADHWKNVADTARKTCWAFGLMTVEIRGFIERMATIESLRAFHARLLARKRPSRGMRTHIRRVKAGARRRAA